MFNHLDLTKHTLNKNVLRYVTRLCLGRVRMATVAMSSSGTYNQSSWSTVRQCLVPERSAMKYLAAIASFSLQPCVMMTKVCYLKY